MYGEKWHVFIPEPDTVKYPRSRWGFTVCADCGRVNESGLHTQAGWLDYGDVHVRR